MYGLGKAEEILGTFAAPHRAEITIATKFGIQVGEGLAKASNVQSTGRWLLQRVPALRKLVKGRLGGNTSRDYSLDGAKASVETSLQALGTDVVDFLLLHEPMGVEGIDPGLADYLEGLRAAGTIRAFGTSAELAVVEALAREMPRLTGVAMVPAPDLATLRGPLLGSAARRVLTFGHLARRDRVAEALKGRSEEVRALDLDPADPDAAGLLILRQAALLNPQGSAIFFTSSPARLRKTAHYVQRPATDDGESVALARLLDGVA